MTATAKTDGSPGDVLALEAASPGDWANDRMSYTLRKLVAADLPSSVRRHVQELGLGALSFFSLNVTFSPGPGKADRAETYPVLAADDTAGPYRFDRVLANQSGLVAVSERTPSAKKDYFAAVKGAVDALGAEVSVGFAGGEASGPLQTSDYVGSEAARTGLHALDEVDLINLMCIPPDTRDPFAASSTQEDWNAKEGSVYSAALTYCRKRRAMLLIDAPLFWAGKVKDATLSKAVDGLFDTLGGAAGANAAVYFPWMQRANAENFNEIEDFPPTGAVAGVMARTDAGRGVWKAPAGVDASVNGAGGLQIDLTDAQQGTYNLLGVNALRSLPMLGTVIWGARTLRGPEVLNDEWKYVPVRRLALYMEESLARGCRWAVFEPNDENLWSSLRTSIGGFMQDLQRQGAFYDYFVRCDPSTTTPQDIELGIVNVWIGFAPVKPAEFVVLHFQQQAAKV